METYPWKTIKALMITFPSFTLKDIMDKTFTNNFHNTNVEIHSKVLSFTPYSLYKKSHKPINSSKHE
jgi:hypothetical protein